MFDDAPHGKGEVGHGNVVCVSGDKSLQGLLVSGTESIQLLLHIADIRDLFEESFRMKEKHVLVFEVVIGLIRERKVPSIHADETFDEWAYLILHPEVGHDFNDGSPTEGLSSEVQLLDINSLPSIIKNILEHVIFH